MLNLKKYQVKNMVEGFLKLSLLIFQHCSTVNMLSEEQSDFQ